MTLLLGACAEFGAISAEFPRSLIRLCWYHVERNIGSVVRRSAPPDIANVIMTRLNRMTRYRPNQADRERFFADLKAILGVLPAPVAGAFRRTGKGRKRKKDSNAVVIKMLRGTRLSFSRVSVLLVFGSVLLTLLSVSRLDCGATSSRLAEISSWDIQERRYREHEVPV